MKSAFPIMALLSAAFSLMLSASCTAAGPADQDFPLGSLENPLILDAYNENHITYLGTVGIETLYIKVINILPPNDAHTVALAANNPLDLYTYSDAFVTQQDFSAGLGGPIYSASCAGTTTAAGELHIMIDGTNTTSDSDFQLTAST